MKQSKKQSKSKKAPSLGRPVWQQEGDELAHVVLPRTSPLEQPTLAYLQLYYQDVVDHLQSPALEQ